MSRVERRATWSATLPGDLPIEGIMPDVILTRKALGMVPGKRLNDVPTAMAEAQEHVLRLCIRRIGDSQVSYDELSHGGLDRLLSPREKELVKRGFKHKRQPTEEELEWYELSLHTEKAGREWRWSGRMLTGKDLKAYKQAEDDLYDTRAELADIEEAIDKELGDLDALNDELEQAMEAVEEAEAAVSQGDQAAVEVEGVLQNSKIIRLCMEQVPKEFKKRGQAFVEKEVSENLIRNCVKRIDGEAVDYSALKETRLDEWLTTKEQNLIIYGIMELGQPDEQEEENFLESWEMG